MSSPAERLDCGCGQPGCTDGAGLRQLDKATEAIESAVGYVDDAEGDWAGNYIDDAIAALCKARQYIGYPSGGCPACGQALPEEGPDGG